MIESYPYVVPYLRAQEGKNNEKRQDKLRQRQDQTRNNKTTHYIRKENKKTGYLVLGGVGRYGTG